MLCSHNNHGHRLNPSFPVKPGADAYKTLPEIRELVRATLLHLGEDADAVLKTVSVEFSRATKRHGGFHYTSDVPRTRASALKVLGRAPTTQREARDPRLLRQMHADNAFDLALKFARDSFEHVPVQDRINTVVHEVCHLVDFTRNQGVLEAGGHGPSWQALMAQCGEEATTSKAAAEQQHSHFRCGCRAGAWQPTHHKSAAALYRAVRDASPRTCMLCGQNIEARPPEARDARSQFNRALAALDRKTPRRPDVSIAAFVTRARSLAASGRRDEAERMLRDALGNVPPGDTYRPVRAPLEQALAEIAVGDVSDEDLLDELSPGWRAGS